MSEVYEAMKERLVEGFVKEAGVTQQVAQGMADEIAITFEDLEKSANMFNASIHVAKDFAPSVGQFAARVGVEAGAKALATLAVAGLAGAAYIGASKAGGAVSNNLNHRAFQAAVEKAINMNSILQRADRGKVAQMAETIFKYAPTAAADPHLLAGVLAHTVGSEGVDVQTIKMLVDLEKVHSGINEPQTSFANFIR